MLGTGGPDHTQVQNLLSRCTRYFRRRWSAGTGVVTLAVGVHDVARIDGWGNLIGNAGSGYWIGRAALEAVMREYDGRGPVTVLTATV
ncbi:BadF/BadG/BcrA/BcrD ATPase family protein, partial [Cryobacterium zongtaii]|uniref:BadF/BadG/BcrA/BcrD ATPase family protein n=1 Tax=Cryobacterium zongtaii TaxID=1259217 RepID=UPI00311AB6BE